MAQTTITYFDFSGSRGEECRLALHLAGVPFVDERLKSAEWQQRKADAPFGALPVLTREGQPPLAQTNAILRLIGREHGLLPSDPWQAARHDAIMDAVEDLRHHMGPMARLKDEAEKRRAREEAASGYLPQWAAQIERQLAHAGTGPFVGGERIGVADLKLFVAMTPYLRGTIDFVPPTVFDGAPRLRALHQAVQSHPSVVEWYARAH